MTWWMWAIIIFVVLAMISGAAEEQKKKEAIAEAKRKQKEAEDYIMSSGDPDAIKMLMLARANPANYSQILAGGMNKGNDTLKTALGVMTGVVAGNMIANAVTASAISSALQEASTDMNSLANDPSLVESDAGGSFGEDFDLFG